LSSDLGDEKTSSSRISGVGQSVLSHQWQIPSGWLDGTKPSLGLGSIASIPFILADEKAF
jgi:hypothetical protein